MNNNIFNIENYKKSDLIEMFGLCDNYTSLNVDTQENILVESILKNTILDSMSKRKTIGFINEAKQILMKDIDLTIGNLYNTNIDLTKTQLSNDFNLIVISMEVLISLVDINLFRDNLILNLVDDSFLIL